MNPRRPGMLLAVKIARAYPDRAPTPKEVQALAPMTYDRAYRWAKAYAQAMQEAK